MVLFATGAKGGVGVRPTGQLQAGRLPLAVVLECQYVLALRRSRLWGLDNMASLLACGGTDNDGVVQLAGLAGFVVWQLSSPKVALFAASAVVAAGGAGDARGDGRPYVRAVWGRGPTRSAMQKLCKTRHARYGQPNSLPRPTLPRERSANSPTS